jgi:hypothetical protein
MKRMVEFFTPERLYKVNIGGVIFNLACAVATILVGLPGEHAQIFLASGLCFFVGAVVNWTIIKIRNHSKK